MKIQTDNGPKLKEKEFDQLLNPQDGAPKVDGDYFLKGENGNTYGLSIYNGQITLTDIVKGISYRIRQNEELVSHMIKNYVGGYSTCYKFVQK